MIAVCVVVDNKDDDRLCVATSSYLAAFKCSGRAGVSVLRQEVIHCFLFLSILPGNYGKMLNRSDGAIYSICEVLGLKF